MKNIEKELQAAAARIDVAISPELTSRLARAVNSTPQNTSGNNPREDSGTRWPFLFWDANLAGGLALGLVFVIAVAVAFIALPGLTDRDAPIATVAGTAPAAGYQDPVARFTHAMDMQSAPEAELQNELQRLNSDWQRIQSRVRNQIDPIL